VARVRHGTCHTSRRRGGAEPVAAEQGSIARAPDTLTLKVHRDQEGRRHLVWVRRALLTLLALILVAALLNAFGQRPSTSEAAAGRAKLSVYAPLRARSGLLYAARFRIDAVNEITKATLVLAPGWAEQYTVNGLAPQPETEGASNGRLVYGFGHIPAGRHLTFWLSLQVNPTNVGRRSQTVTLADGDTPLATVHRTITVWP
jgi:hypothetical protein